MKTKQVVYWLGILAGAGIGVALGCTRDLPLHCRNNFGDLSCTESGKGDYCDRCSLENDGCTNTPPTESCHFSGDGTGIVVSGTESETLGESSTGSTSIDSVDGGVSSQDAMTVGGATTLGENSDGSETTSGTAGCEACSVEAPVCVDGECVSCDEKDPDACNGHKNGQVCSDGECVQCAAGNTSACGGATPLCNTSSGTCVAGCVEHDDCGDAACNLYDNTCFPADKVVHVGAGQMFMLIPPAVNSFAPGEQVTIVVHAGEYSSMVDIGDGRTVAFLGDPAAPPTWTSPGMPQLTVTDGTVFLDGLEISENPGAMPAVQLSGEHARVWVDRSRIVNNVGGGILAQDGSDLIVRNCFVGGDDESVHALEINESSAQISYSTLITGVANEGESPTRALLCAMSSVDVSDSVLLRYGNLYHPVSCQGANFDSNASEQLLWGTNVNVGWFGGMDEVGSNWFMDAENGDFTLTPTGAVVFADIAHWDNGDPLTDIEGNPRNKNNDDPDHAGADQP